jgi:hypothetical protein
MSPENVEAVRRAYEVAYAERSVENVLVAVDEDFVGTSARSGPGVDLCVSRCKSRVIGAGTPGQGVRRRSNGRTEDRWQASRPQAGRYGQRQDRVWLEGERPLEEQRTDAGK